VDGGLTARDVEHRQCLVCAANVKHADLTPERAAEKEVWVGGVPLHAPALAGEGVHQHDLVGGQVEQLHGLVERGGEEQG
jgi:hypothetical protein